jgi:hypothetical protein
MFTSKNGLRLIALRKHDQIAFLRAVCRIAADRIENGGTFPIQGETWAMLDFAAGKTKPSPNENEESK